MQAENELTDTQHEYLANDYLYRMSLVDLAELARAVGVSQESLVRRALNARFQRYYALSQHKKSS